MIRRSVWVKTVVFVVIAALGIAYVLVHYVGVGRGLLGTEYTAYVDLRDSGGLFSSASVTYRGVEVGRVGAISLRPNGIRVALNLSTSLDIPADSRALVGNGSPIGEQFIDLRPANDRGPYLHQGSVIPQSRTSLPTSTEELLVSLDRLVRSVPRQDLHSVVTELGHAFGGAGPDLGHLLDATQQLVASAQQNLPQTKQLLADSGTALDTQNQLSNSIVDFSRNLATFTGALRHGDRDLRAVLRSGVPAGNQLTALDRSIDATLPLLLSDVTSAGRVTAARTPALRQVLIIYPYVVATSFGLFPGNGSTRFGIPTPPEEDHQPCLKGYIDPKKRRSPDVLTYPPIRYGSFCQEPTSADVNARGSREAPEPDGKRLGDEPSYRNNAGLPHGAAVAADGRADLAAGESSWMRLLFGPLN